MNKIELVKLATQIALAHELPPDVVCGVIERESSWQPWATRYEPNFMSKYVAPQYVSGKMTATEAYTRAMSWGLMQIMGETAREFGFAEPFAAELCDPATGIEFGCRKLADCFRRAKGNLHDALEMWNGGDNESYAEEVVLVSRNYRTA